MGVGTLGFYEELMRGFVGKSDDFCLYAGAITGPDAGDLAIVKRRLRQSFTQDFVHLFVGMDNPAGALRQPGSDAGKE